MEHLSCIFGSNGASGGDECGCFECHFKNCGRCWIPDFYMYLAPNFRRVILTYLLALYRLKIKVPKFVQLKILCAMVQNFYPESTFESPYFSLILKRTEGEEDYKLHQQLPLTCSGQWSRPSKYFGQIEVGCCRRVTRHLRINGLFYCRAHINELAIQTIESIVTNYTYLSSAQMPVSHYYYDHIFGLIRKRPTDSQHISPTVVGKYKDGQCLPLTKRDLHIARLLNLNIDTYAVTSP